MAPRHDNSQLKLKSRDWCFTLNNYKAIDEAILRQLDSKYLIYGYETAPETGTPHLQGYVYFENEYGAPASQNHAQGHSILQAPSKKRR